VPVFFDLEKEEPAELGRVEAASDILGSFRNKKLLQETLFLIQKTPKFL